MRTIERVSDGTMLNFETLNEAIRALNLIEKTNRKRFAYEASKVLLEKNGYRLIASDFKKATPVERVGAEVTKVVPAEESAKVINAFAKIIGDIAVSDEKITTAVNAKMMPFAEGIRGYVDGELTSMKDEVADLVSKNLPKEIVVVRHDDTRVNVGTQHEKFEHLLRLISIRQNVLLVGPAGSGKTTAAEKVAEALGLRYFAISVGMQTTKTEFFGYTDANGRCVRPLFREAYENGGMFLIDEFDAGSSNVIISINQALANGECAFPDGMIKKHPDFVCLASGNTYGHGASRDYIGRNPLDAASLDRFMTLAWGYDLKLEDALCPDKKWLGIVRQMRANAMTHKIRTVVSPRASISGAKMLAIGFALSETIEIAVLKGIGKTDADLLLKGVSI